MTAPPARATGRARPRSRSCISGKSAASRRSRRSGSTSREHAADATESQRAFATTIVDGTVADLPAIDPIIAAHSQHWRLERLAVIDRLVLRLAVWELRHEADTPAPVVINEAIELARRFGTDDSVGFVNGVLDAIRKGLKA